MRKARRISVWMIVVVMLVGLVGCAKEPTAEEVYAAAFEKMNALTSMDAEMDMDIAMKMAAPMDGEVETIHVEMAADFVMEHINTEDMRMDMKMKMGLMGVDIEMQTYYADGYYLMEMYGQKLKYPMDLKEAMSQTAMVQEVALDAMSEMTMIEEGDNRVITFTVDGTKLKEGYMDDYLSTMEGMGLADASATDSLNYEAMSGTMTVNKEGYPTAATMNMTFTMKVEGTEIAYEAAVEIVYNNPGQDVSVEIPDTSEYMEVDPESLS